MTAVATLLAGIRERHDETATRLISGHSNTHDGLAAIGDRSRLLTALEAVAKVHEPVDALMNPGHHERVVKVCTGCGTDDPWNGRSKRYCSRCGGRESDLQW